MSGQTWYRWEGSDLLLAVHIQPRSHRDEIVGPYGAALKIRLTAAPLEGQANSQLLKFLASLFGVPVARVILISGTSGRAKRIRIITPGAMPEKLREWMEPLPMLV